MDAMEAILTRRSVRRFTKKEVSEVIIEKLLKAAMSAPSAGNDQPWHFLVVRQRTFLDKIAKVHPYAGMCSEATVAIIPCVDVKLEKYQGFWVQDLSTATQNILLAVRALGLGSVWVGVYPQEDRMSEIRKLFSIPDDIMPFCIVPVGYTDKEQGVVNRYQADRVHFDQW